MAIEVTPPFQEFTDLSGAPLDNGYIYIGTENLNPEVNLISIYWDEAFTTPAANPVRTIAGYPSRNGSPGRIFVKSAYSIIVKDKNSQLVYSSLSNNSTIQSAIVGTIAALRTTVYSGQPFVSVTGYYTAEDNIGVREYYWDATSTEADNGGTIIAVTGVATGRWKMKHSGAVNVKWFGAKCDGATDDTVETGLAKAVGDIIIEGDTINTSTTMTSYYGNGTVYSSVGVLNTKFSKMGSISTDSNIKLRKISCVIRQDTASSGWYAINDTGHKPVGVNPALAVDVNGDLVLSYNFTATDVGSLVIGQDETYANLGVDAGASVGDTSSTIKLYKNFEAEVNLSASTIVESTYFLGTGTVINNGNGTSTITFPAGASSSIIPYIVDKGARKTSLISKTASSITVGQYERFSGYIYYDGTAWQVSTGAYTKPTMSFTAGVLTVTHETLLSTEATVTVTERSGAIVAQNDGYSATTFTVVFRDFAGTILTTAATSMRFYYSGNDNVLQSNCVGNIFVSVPLC
ncbi:MAG: hypothetical protein WC464_00005, partial [Bdellovibrionales bacterium]